MMFLSLDLSTRSSGFAVYDGKHLMSYGTIKSADKDYLVRANRMADGVKELLEKYPDISVVIVEELKVISNQKILAMLGILQGMVLRECVGRDIQLVAPTVWRKPFHLNGKRTVAKKKAIKLCEQHNLVVKNDDEAEAIIIGKFFLSSLDKLK